MREPVGAEAVLLQLVFSVKELFSGSDIAVYIPRGGHQPPGGRASNTCTSGRAASAPECSRGPSALSGGSRAWLRRRSRRDRRAGGVRLAGEDVIRRRVRLCRARSCGPSRRCRRSASRGRCRRRRPCTRRGRQGGSCSAPSRIESPALRSTVCSRPESVNVTRRRRASHGAGFSPSCS